MSSLLKRQDNQTNLTNTLFVLAITLLGSFLRLLYLQKTDFVLNDGGMFYTMILDLQMNNFSLPRFTSYNFSQIPYAYPPLSFYIGAAINQFQHIDLITILRIYPLIFNILSIPVFFFLAQEITHRNRQSLLATAFYAILLPGYEWLISGGGLTRSPAHTLFIIVLFLYIHFLHTQKRRYLFLSIFIASLMTLHHLEYCWVLAFSLVLFSYGTLKLMECLKNGAIYLAGMAILTAPYWFTVISFHGIAPFVSAFSTGDFNLLTSIGRLFLMVFTRESIVNYVNVLAIIGLWFSLFRKNYREVIWLLLIIFLAPRSAERLLIFPVTILAAYTIDSVLIPAVEITSQTSAKILSQKTVLNNAAVLILFSVAFPFILGVISTSDDHPGLTALSRSEREAMSWIKDNTRADGTFMVIDPISTWSADRISEWFPALAERKNLTTIQGSEWLADSAYSKYIARRNSLFDCLKNNNSCLKNWIDGQTEKIDYIVISKNSPLVSSTIDISSINSSLGSSPDFRVVFSNDSTIVYSAK